MRKILDYITMDKFQVIVLLVKRNKRLLLEEKLSKISDF